MTCRTRLHPRLVSGLSALVLAVTLAACGATSEDDESSATTQAAPTTTEPEESAVSPACDDAFETVSEKDEGTDAVADLYPAAKACQSLDEWVRASERHPGAIDGAPPEVFARNVCLYGEDPGLATTSLCVELAG